MENIIVDHSRAGVFNYICLGTWGQLPWPPQQHWWGSSNGKGFCNGGSGSKVVRGLVKVGLEVERGPGGGVLQQWRFRYMVRLRDSHIQEWVCLFPVLVL